MRKIVFLPGAYDGCYYYRGYLPAVYGETAAILDFAEHNWNTKTMHDLAMSADVVVFQRPNDINRVELMKLLKLKGKKIVFENDDTYLFYRFFYLTRKIIRRFTGFFKPFLQAGRIGADFYK